MTKQVTPTNSRYVPLTQQPYCCVPASIQIIMYKLGLPLTPQEALGYHLGLVVPPEDKEVFWRVRVSHTPPSAAGYGTQIQKAQYDPNKAFQKLHISLTFSRKLIDTFVTVGEVRSYLRRVEKEDQDVIACFKYGVLYDTDQTAGHASVFDHYLSNTDEVRLIDPAPRVAKWRVVPMEKFFRALKEHGPDNSGGFWEIRRV